jgi:hypothetical protein
MDYIAEELASVLTGEKEVEDLTDKLAELFGLIFE